jgi:hypothetical protein
MAVGRGEGVGTTLDYRTGKEIKKVLRYRIFFKGSDFKKIFIFGSS